MTSSSGGHRKLLYQIARDAMIRHGLHPDFSPAAMSELEALRDEAPSAHPHAKDLRSLLWCSIDNDDSRDLDQLTVAEPLDSGVVRLYIAIADVDHLVEKDSEIDLHAAHNTTSVYTPAKVFSMLPERLSTDLTSMNPDVDRAAMVVEFDVMPDGSIARSDIYPALVHNHARLAYNAVAGWLEGRHAALPNLEEVEGLGDNLRLQDDAAQRMKAWRHEHGALDLETVDARPVIDGDVVKEVQTSLGDRAKSLVEDFMIAANGAAARYLAERNYPSVRRVVDTPRRWERLVMLAKEKGFVLPAEPNSQALVKFLDQQRAAHPEEYLELSVSVIKLLGPGEYKVQVPGEISAGHFGLAVRDYSHSTAPNRRYADLLTQRLLKAAFTGDPVPYELEDLQALARRCTLAEDAARKVERQVRKAAMALVLQPHIGEVFDAIVTGAADKGTWVRTARPASEGRLIRGFEGADVGDRLKVRLTSIDARQGFIDFERVR